ncbi:S8 family peptidase, partial [Acinetobacter nosocomialis]|nr:S8 family peptidase [Acinetobacter nosocomialis]
MKIRKVSAVFLSMAATHLAYAAPNLLNSAIDSSQAKGIIKNQYIVILNKDIGPAKDFAQNIAKQHGGRILQSYDSALKGF